MARRDVGTVGNKRQVVPLRRKKPPRRSKKFTHSTSRPVFLTKKRKGRR